MSQKSTIEQLLNATQVGSNKNEYLMLCPDCGTKDNKPKLYYNVKKKIGYCQRCDKTYKLFDIVKDDIAYLVKNALLQGEKQGRDETLDEKATLTTTFDEIISIFEYKPALEYAYSRGLTARQIYDYKICYAPTGQFAERMMIPIEFGGQVKGFIGRDITGQQDPKYKFMTGFSWSKYLYPENNIRKNTVLVEGTLDAILTESVCTFSSHISKEQIQILKEHKVKKIYLAFDRDTVGNKKMHRSCKRLYESGFGKASIRPIVLPKGKDPADLGKDKLWEVIKSQDNFINLYKFMKELRR